MSDAAGQLADGFEFLHDVELISGLLTSLFGAHATDGEGRGLGKGFHLPPVVFRKDAGLVGQADVSDDLCADFQGNAQKVLYREGVDELPGIERETTRGAP